MAQFELELDGEVFVFDDESISQEEAVTFLNARQKRSEAQDQIRLDADQAQVTQERALQAADLNEQRKEAARQDPGSVGFFQRIDDALKGNQQNPLNLPELDLSSATSPVASLLPLATTGEERADLAATIMTDEGIEFDEILNFEGRALVTFPDGSAAFVNQPGISGRDFTEAVGQFGAFTPAALLSRGAPQIGGRGLLVGAANLGIRGTLVAGATGGTEALRQAGIDLTTKGELDPELDSIGLLTALGAGAEVVGPLASALGRTVRNRFFVRSDGTLTPRGKERFNELGIDPAFVEGNPRALEVFRRAPGFGGRRAAQETVDQALPEEAVSAALTGRARVAQEAGETVTGALRQADAGSKAEARSALRQIEESDTVVQGEFLDFSSRRVAQDGGVPDVVQDFNTMVLGQSRSGSRPGSIDRSPLGSVKRYDAFRKATERRLQGASEGEREAIENTLAAFDDQMAAAVEHELVKGNADDVAQALRGTTLRREVTARLSDSRQINRIINDDQLTPEDAVNLILGASKTIPGSRQGATNAVGEIKRITGEDSEAFLAVKDQVIQQLFRGARTGRVLDRDEFANRWTELRRSNKSLVDELFTETEQRALFDIASNPQKGSNAIRAIGDFLTVRYGVAGAAVAGAIRRLGGILEPLPAVSRPLLPGTIIRGGAVAQGALNEPGFDGAE